MKRALTQTAMVAVTMIFLVFGFFGVGLACDGIGCELESTGAATDIHNRQQVTQQATPLSHGMSLKTNGSQHIFGELFARPSTTASFEAYAGHQVGLEKDIALNGGKIGTVFSYATAEALLSGGTTPRCENPKFDLRDWHKADMRVTVDWNKAAASINTKTGFSLTEPKSFTSSVHLETLDGYNVSMPSGGNMSGYTQTNITK